MGNSYRDLKLSRRSFLHSTAAVATALTAAPFTFGCGNTAQNSSSSLVNSKFGGVQIGAITYSWRSMPSSAEEVLQYCLDCGLSSIELMSPAAESYAGIPEMPARPARDATEEEQEAYNKARIAATEAQKEWRLSVPMTRFEEMRKMYNDAGVNMHIVKFSPGRWSAEEIDYAFRAAKALGAVGVTDEIGEEACKSMGPIAEKHGMYAIFHQHLQPGEPGWTFEHFLDMHPANMLNFDAGHYFGATGLHPNGIIERLHDRIVSIHMKDKTGPNGDPANTNMPWGQGETPIADIYKLLQREKWPIECDIELEYPVPEDSDAVLEVKKCVEYSKAILES